MFSESCSHLGLLLQAGLWIGVDKVDLGRPSPGEVKGLWAVVGVQGAGDPACSEASGH